MTMSKPTTPYHLPRGTVIETTLYKVSDSGEPEMNFSHVQKPYQFTVDHILIVDGWYGREYMVVTTTQRPNDSVLQGENITFNIDHVDRVVKRGDKMLFKKHLGSKAPHKESWNNKKQYSSSDLYNLIIFKLNQDHPLLQFDIEGMFNIALLRGTIRHNVGVSKYHWYYTTNRRKLNDWIKRNKNRFIYSRKELDAIRKASVDEESRQMEKEWDRNYLSDFDDVPEGEEMLTCATDHQVHGTSFENDFV